jgi:hypothetical protein
LYQKLNASPLGACFDIEDASEDWADEIAQAKTAITVVSEAPFDFYSTWVILSITHSQHDTGRNGLLLCSTRK